MTNISIAQILLLLSGKEQKASVWLPVDPILPSTSVQYSFQGLPLPLCSFDGEKRTPFFLMVENTVRWEMMQPDRMGVKLFLSKSDEDLILF